MEPASVLTRRDKLIAAGLVVLFLIMGYVRMVPQVCGAYHDDALYVITAKALAQGLGYKLINLPQAPLQTKYPILYPGLLALVWKLWPNFPDNLWLMKGLTVLGGAATMGLTYLFLLRFNYFPRGVALSAALLCATCPFFLYFASNTLSEIPFALLTVAAMWAMEAQIRAPAWSRNRQFWSGVLLALPFLCRIIGASLVLAGVVVLYYWRRPLRWVILGAAVVVLPWLLWMLAGLGAWNRDPVSGYYTDYLGWWSSTGPGLLGKAILGNLPNIIWSLAILSLEGLDQLLTAAQLSAWPLLALLIGLIPLIVVIRQLTKGQILPYYLMFYWAIVFLWPWPPIRFIIPILPLVLGYLCFGLWALARNLPRPALFRRLALVVVSVLVLTNLFLLYRGHAVSQQTGYPFVNLPAHPASWSEHEKLFHWLRSHTEPQDILASWEGPMVYLYTGRRAIRPCRITPAPLMGYGDEGLSFGTVAELRRTLDAYRVRYLVKIPVYAFDEKEIDRLIDGLTQQYPGRVKPVYAGRDPRFAVLEVAPEK